MIGMLVGDGADLGHAMVIEDAGAAPEFGDALADFRNAAAGFAGDDDFFQGQVGEILGVLFGENALADVSWVTPHKAYRARSS